MRALIYSSSTRKNRRFFLKAKIDISTISYALAGGHCLAFHIRQKYLEQFSARILIVVLFATVLMSLPVQSGWAEEGLTPCERDVVALVNGSQAYAYDLHLESIAFSHPAFRVAGSAGATEAADWIADQFAGFGLEVNKTEFQFTRWDLLSRSTLVVDDDGDPVTTDDQNAIESFLSADFGLPGHVFADLVVLPLPEAANVTEIGKNPIDTTVWDSFDTTGKIVLIGLEVCSAGAWEETYVNKLSTQTPEAVIHTWWYDWNSFAPYAPGSGQGRPWSMARWAQFGSYYWDLNIPVGFVFYNDGLFIRNREASADVSAEVVIDSVLDVGPHYNVVGKLIGHMEPEKIVIVCGHYDTPMCAGFMDNGAGTSGVIELARVFSEAVRRGLYYPKYTLVFLALTGEEILGIGAVYYVKEHKDQMPNILAVLNLDGIGSEDLVVGETAPADEFDFDQLVLSAAADLGTAATLTEGISDEQVFKDPAFFNWALEQRGWGINFGIDDATPVNSSSGLSSHPAHWYDKWDIGTPGWAHTAYDNSTSTETLGWVEVDDLEAHVKVAALTMMRVSPPVLVGDLNSDGVVDIFDVVTVSVAFGSTPLDPNWNIAADLNRDDVVDIFDVVTVTSNFGKTA